MSGTMPTRVTRVALSSSRDPSIRVRQFLNELAEAIPNSVKINRGRMSLDDLVVRAIEHRAKYILYVMTRKGNPLAIKFIEINEKEATYRWLPYVIKLIGVKLIVDMPVRRAIKKKARSAIIVMLDYHEVGDLLSQILNIPAVQTRNLDQFQGKYDTIIVVRPVYNRPDFTGEIQFLDGEDFGPIGPIIRISRVYYLTGKEAVLSPDLAELLGE